MFVRDSNGVRLIPIPSFRAFAARPQNFSLYISTATGSSFLKVATLPLGSVTSSRVTDSEIENRLRRFSLCQAHPVTPYCRFKPDTSSYSFSQKMTRTCTLPWRCNCFRNHTIRSRSLLPVCVNRTILGIFIIGGRIMKIPDIIGRASSPSSCSEDPKCWYPNKIPNIAVPNLHASYQGECSNVDTRATRTLVTCMRDSVFRLTSAWNKCEGCASASG